MRHGKYDHENLSESAQPRLSTGDDWRERRECRDSDPEIFFPEDADDDLERRARTIQAKSVCARCDVREMCLDFALRNGDDAGIFGGLDADERQPLVPGYDKRPQLEKVRIA